MRVECEYWSEDKDGCCFDGVCSNNSCILSLRRSISDLKDENFFLKKEIEDLKGLSSF